MAMPTVIATPRCPKCGEPARVVHVLAMIRCQLNSDGSAGKILGVANRGVAQEYECGGGHVWPSVQL